MWIELSVIIFIILLIITVYSVKVLYYLVDYKKIYLEIPFDRISLSKIYSSLKTGDLLFYRHSVASIINDILTPSSLYKHGAMIIKYNNELYITESVMSEYYCRDNGVPIKLREGINTVPLKKRLEYYCGVVYLFQLNKPLEPEREKKLIDYCITLKDRPYPSTFDIYLNFIFNIRIKKSLYCFEYLYVLLKYINLLKEQKNNAFEICTYISSIDKHELNNNFSYKNGKLLVYDYDLF
jgi:hypothetical protein